MLTFSPEGTGVGTATGVDITGSGVDIGAGVDTGIGTGKEDEDGIVGGQVPKAGWQPVPQ